jgi:hypothetical protein
VEPAPGGWPVAEYTFQRLAMYRELTPAVLGPDGLAAPMGMRLDRLREQLAAQPFHEMDAESLLAGPPGPGWW